MAPKKKYASWDDSCLRDEVPPTPFYLYSETRLTQTVVALKKAFVKFPCPLDHHFAFKANNNVDVLQCLLTQGFGADVVSGGELEWALHHGFPAEKIVFSGVGKTRDELKLAVESRIGLINIESEFEYDTLTDLVSDWDARPEISFRINPNVNAKSHPYISTGLKTHKFGLTLDRARALYERAAKNKNLTVKGVSVHIGSQMADLRPLADALSKTLQFIESLSREARRHLSILDVGGGLGINYKDPDALADFEKYSKVLKKVALRWKEVSIAPEPRMACENGRSIVAQSGRLVSRVIGVKQTNKIPFAIIDASMSELLRPSLYQARHEIRPLLRRIQKTKLTRFNVVGPVCESSDTFGEAYLLPAHIKENSLVAVESCGAYGATMSSFYNIRALPAEYWLDIGGKLHLSRARQSFADLYSTAR